jgi:PAS domain S-box-containing protein
MAVQRARKRIDADVGRRPAGRRKRSLDEIARELERLQHGSVGERERISLVHDISVYQEELLVQNEALMEAQAALEQTRDRFIDLYDFAPTPYLTVDARGVVRLCNLTAAAWFGRSKTALEGLPLIGLIVGPQRTRFADFMQRWRHGESALEEEEFGVRTAEGTRRAHILCRCLEKGGYPRQ